MMKSICLGMIFLVFMSSTFLFGCAAYQSRKIQELQMPSREAPFQAWLLFYEEQFRLNGDNTPMPPSDAPEAVWQAYAAAKNNYATTKVKKMMEEETIGALVGTVAGIVGALIIIQILEKQKK